MKETKPSGLLSALPCINFVLVGISIIPTSTTSLGLLRGVSFRDALEDCGSGSLVRDEAAGLGVVHFTCLRLMNVLTTAPGSFGIDGPQESV